MHCVQASDANVLLCFVRLVEVGDPAVVFFPGVKLPVATKLIVPRRCQKSDSRVPGARLGTLSQHTSTINTGSLFSTHFEE